jgi:GNAT superfamily N-acetyltransferase
MIIREVKPSDIDDIFVIRTSTVENDFTMAQLAEIDITPESVSGWLKGDVKGWLCEVEGKKVGFTLGDGGTGEMLVVAVLPGYESRGVGKGLLRAVQDWLFEMGHETLWLWSNPDPNVRAHGFYRRLGWLPTGEMLRNDEKLIYVKGGDENGD